MKLEEIKSQSPFLEGYDDEPIQMAFYSANCCWWTSFPDDLGSLPPMRYSPGKDGKPGRMIKDPGGHSLPCCPHCGSVLLQAPLLKFIEAAEATPTHYGKYGIQTFIISHERNSMNCYRKWETYDILIDPFGVK